MTATITFTVNGRQETVTTDDERSLLDVLREDLRLTGAKYACGEGRCGACTVLIDGRPVRSCVTLATVAAGKHVLTIEGLAEGDALHPVQQAFLSESAFQCGFCTPGMIMATVALLRETPSPTDEQIRAALNGNLCRCCDYPSILRAVRRAAQALPAATPPAPPSQGRHRQHGEKEAAAGAREEASPRDPLLGLGMGRAGVGRCRGSFGHGSHPPPLAPASSCAASRTARRMPG